MQEVINDPEIDIVVELIGGVHPAYEYILATLKHGNILLPQTKILWQIKARIFEERKNNVDVL